MTANKACLTRLQKEYKALLKVRGMKGEGGEAIRCSQIASSPVRMGLHAHTQEPVPHIAAHPSNSLLEWHFVLEGAKGTDYEGGLYHGKLVFPPQYPFKPPSISLFTPNGRFAVNTKLCLSMTDYHPESWNPMWSVGGCSAACNLHGQRCNTNRTHADGLWHARRPSVRHTVCFRTWLQAPS